MKVSSVKSILYPTWISIRTFHTCGHALAQLVFAGRIPDGVGGIFHWRNPWGRTGALGSTQPPAEMSTRNISWYKGGRCLGLTNLLSSCADFPEIWEPQTPATVLGFINLYFLHLLAGSDDNWHKLSVHMLLVSGYAEGHNFLKVVEWNLHVHVYRKITWYLKNKDHVDQLYCLTDFNVLLTVHLSSTLVNDQLEAQLLYFITRLLQSSTCFEQRRAHQQEVKLY